MKPVEAATNGLDKPGRDKEYAAAMEVGAKDGSAIDGNPKHIKFGAPLNEATLFHDSGKPVALSRRIRARSSRVVLAQQF